MAPSYLKYPPNVQALHLQTLIIQHDHLLFVRDRHLHWAGDAADAQIRSLHIGIADSLEQAASQLEHLIEGLQTRHELEEGLEAPPD